MVSVVIIVYIVLLVFFLLASAMIFRHTLKFSYLSPRFKAIIMTFGIIALAVIIYTIYLVISLYHQQSSPSTFSPSPATSTSDINF